MNLTHVVERSSTPIILFVGLVLAVCVSLGFLWIEAGVIGVLLGLATTFVLFAMCYAFLLVIAHLEGIPPIRLMYSFPSTLFLLLVFLITISYALLTFDFWNIFTFAVFTTLLLFQVILEKQSTQVRINGQTVEIKSKLPFVSSMHQLETPIRYMMLKAVGSPDRGAFGIAYENAPEGDQDSLYFLIQATKHPLAVQVASNAQPDQIKQLLSHFPDSERIIPSTAMIDNGSGIIRGV